jgi:hypothetical protein
MTVAVHAGGSIGLFDGLLGHNLPISPVITLPGGSFPTLCLFDYLHFTLALDVIFTRKNASRFKAASSLGILPGFGSL